MSKQYQNKIDYTKMRKSSKNQIDYCPKCGRKGKLRKYTNGDMCFFHKSERKAFGYSVVDYCYIKAPESN